jgi:hypothetical protein
MIPREILKQIQQIETCTNRIVSESAVGARLCEPQHLHSSKGVENSEHLFHIAAAAGRRPALPVGARASARFTLRIPNASETNPAPNAIRTLKRREPRAPAALERGCPSRSTSALVRALESLQDRTPIEAAAGKTLALRLLQPSVEFCRIARGVEERKHSEHVILDCKVNGVFVESPETNLLRPATDSLKMTRIGQRTPKRNFHFQLKLAAKSRASRFIPGNRLLEFQTRLASEDDRKAHCQPKRLLRSASTCSQGIPSRGSLSNSARRRSSSAACSGVSAFSKSPYFSRTISATSSRSAKGNFSICSRISVALMAEIYPVDLTAQVGLFLSRITHHASRCP